MQLRDLTEQTFGRLTAKRRVGTTPHGKAIWECICQCGTVCQKSSNLLVRGDAKSCGCLHRDTARSPKKHGYAGHRTKQHPLYRIWCSAKARCHTPTDAAYRRYGARGIYMAQEWRDSFPQFLADTGERPPKTTLERRDNNGPYCRANCCWATRQAQARNTRRTKLIVWNGQAQTLGAWAAVVQIPESALYYRLSHGWTVEEALTTPSRKRHNPK